MADEIGGATAPLACSLTDADREQRGGEIADLFAAVQQVEELPDGYSFAFPGGDATARQLLEFVLAERDCCPFFTFALVSAPDHGTIRLEWRGPDEAKLMIAGAPVPEAARRG